MNDLSCNEVEPAQKDCFTVRSFSVALWVGPTEATKETAASFDEFVKAFFADAIESMLECAPYSCASPTVLGHEHLAKVRAWRVLLLLKTEITVDQAIDCFNRELAAIGWAIHHTLY